MSSLETRVQFPAGEMFKMPGLVSFFFFFTLLEQLLVLPTEPCAHWPIFACVRVTDGG